MSNSLLNISMITREALMELKNQLAFSAHVNRSYDDKFAREGAKIGQVINIRKPLRYETTSGKALTVQDSEDQSVALTLDSQEHVGMQFSSKELTLNIEDFRKRYIQPAVTALANKIDLDGTSQYVNVFSSVGTPGTQPTALTTALQAGQKLYENGAPRDGNIAMVCPPSTEVAFVGAGISLFNDQKELGMQYKKGRMGRAAGFDWYMDQNMPTHTVGALGGTPAVKTTLSSQGATSFDIDGASTSVTGYLKQGDVISIAGVYAVNPQTRQSTGSLKQFVVTADVNTDGGGEATVPVSPEIRTTGPYATVDSFPADGDAVTIFGHASSYAAAVSPTSMAYHRDAFALGMADLELPGGVDMAGRASDPDAGLSIRIISDYDINNDNKPTRLDALYGWKTIYAELACRVQG